MMAFCLQNLQPDPQADSITSTLTGFSAGAAAGIGHLSLLGSLLFTLDPGTTPGPVKFLRAIDVDQHNFVLNRKGKITFLLVTNEDTQEEARAAGEAVYPFQGKRDFQLVVVVDLRGSIANWAPSITQQLTQRNLDDEARNLKPYYLRNGNHENPRKLMHVVTDFKGATCDLLGWTTSSDSLRGIVFGETGAELRRWDKLTDLKQVQEEVQKALEAYEEKRRPGKALPASD